MAIHTLPSLAIEIPVTPYELLRLKLKLKYDWKTKMYDKAISVKINEITHSEGFADDVDLIIAKANLFDKLVEEKVIKYERTKL